MPTNTLRPGWSFLRSRRWLGYLALLLTFSIACVLLGNWQFARRAEARAEIARIDRNYDATPIDLEAALPELNAYDDDAQKWQRVTTTGEYLGDTYLARNRPGEGGVGSLLIAPFRTDHGAVIMVDRGWVDVSGTEALDSPRTAAESIPALPQGEVSLVVRLRAGEPAVTGRSSSGITVASINLAELARLSGTEGSAYLGAYGMLVSEDPSTATGVLPDRPERDEGPHLSYALQWYVFIVVAAIGVAYAARAEYRVLNDDEDAATTGTRHGRTPLDPKKPRKRFTDDEIEDAILDQR